MRPREALLLSSLLLTLLPGSLLAQEAEGGAASARYVAPEECVAEARSFEEIAAMLSLDGEGVPAPAMPRITPPLGELADAETRTAVRDVVRGIIACFNAGDIPRAAGLMTESGVRRVYWGLTIDEENRTLARERIPAPPERRADPFLVRLIAVTDVTVLPDERAAAFVVLNEPLLPPGGPETLLMLFANQDGRWLLDDMIDFSIVPVAPAAESATS